MDEPVAAATHLIAHLFDVAVPRGRRHQGERVGKGEVRAHRGVFTRLEQFGLGQALVALHRFIDQTVNAAPDARGCSIRSPDPLRPGLHRLAFAVAQIDAAGRVEQVVALVGAAGLIIVLWI